MDRVPAFQMPSTRASAAPSPDFDLLPPSHRHCSACWGTHCDERTSDCHRAFTPFHDGMICLTALLVYFLSNGRPLWHSLHSCKYQTRTRRWGSIIIGLQVTTRCIRRSANRSCIESITPLSRPRSLLLRCQLSFMATISVSDMSYRAMKPTSLFVEGC